MKITFYGHASLGIEVNGKHIIVDPYISANPKAANIDINTLQADFILLTHAHGDHILDVEAIASRTNGVLFLMLRLLDIMLIRVFNHIL